MYVHKGCLQVTGVQKQKPTCKAFYKEQNQSGSLQQSRGYKFSQLKTSIQN